jgi:hypothetical protein
MMVFGKAKRCRMSEMKSTTLSGVSLVIGLYSIHLVNREKRRRKKGTLIVLLPVDKRKKETPGKDIEEQRRRRKVTSQGLMRNYRKLQGPICKTKFPVDLKPKRRNAQNESWRVFQTLQHYFRAQVQKLKTYIFTHEFLNKGWI